MTGRAAMLIMALFGPLPLIPRVAAAQTECAAGKVAFVQVPVILASISRYAQEDSTVAIDVAANTVEVSRLRGVLDSATSAYQEKSALLSGPAAQLEFKKLRDQNAQIQRRVQGLQQRLGQQRQSLLGPTENGVEVVIDSIRAELKCAIIFDVGSASGITSVNKSLDLTNRVITRIKTTGDTALFGPRTPTSEEQCKDTGWQNVRRLDGSAFKDRVDCLQYVHSAKP